MIRPLAWLLELLYPSKCTLCDCLLKDNETDLCSACRLLLSDKTCQRMRGEFFQTCIAPYRYDEPLRQSLLRYKFEGCSHYAPTYGRLLAMCIQTELDGKYDLITWTPVSYRRRRQRGYDQAQLLAAAAAKELGLPLVQTLRKIRDNPKQSGISDPAARRANVLGVYQPVRSQRFAGKRVLLIDDIATTGSTLSECSRTLQTAGAAKVICAVLAIAEKKR